MLSIIFDTKGFHGSDSMIKWEHGTNSRREKNSETQTEKIFGADADIYVDKKMKFWSL